jgi:hypothetical protein
MQNFFWDIYIHHNFLYRTPVPVLVLGARAECGWVSPISKYLTIFTQSSFSHLFIKLPLWLLAAGGWLAWLPGPFDE